MVVKDFGWRKWSKGLDCEFIDTTGMSDTAGEALMRWSLSSISKPFIVHAKWEELDLQELFSHHQEMESCKLVIAKQELNFPTKISQKILPTAILEYTFQREFLFILKNRMRWIV